MNLALFYRQLISPSPAALYQISTYKLGVSACKTPPLTFLYSPHSPPNDQPGVNKINSLNESPVLEHPITPPFASITTHYILIVKTAIQCALCCSPGASIPSGDSRSGGGLDGDWKEGEQAWDVYTLFFNLLPPLSLRAPLFPDTFVATPMSLPGCPFSGDSSRRGELGGGVGRAGAWTGYRYLFWTPLSQPVASGSAPPPHVALSLFLPSLMDTIIRCLTERDEAGGDVSLPPTPPPSVVHSD